MNHMLKIRLMGTEDELKNFKSYLEMEQSAYAVTHISKMYRNKGTKKHLRMYAEIEKNGEERYK